MKEINELNLPADVRYSAEHEWAKASGATARIGIDDYAQDRLGEIVYVELPEVGTVLAQGDTLGNVESVKAVSEVYTPLSGEVVAVNESLADAPELVNNDCYGAGWIAELRLSAPEELESLQESTAYRNSLKD